MHTVGTGSGHLIVALSRAELFPPVRFLVHLRSAGGVLGHCAADKGFYGRISPGGSALMEMVGALKK